ATDPPFHSELRMLPARARPVPFCLHGFRPPPETSPRVLVECVPRRWLARYDFTASQSRLWLGGAVNISSASSSSLTVAPSRFFTSSLAIRSDQLTGLKAIDGVLWPCAPGRNLPSGPAPSPPPAGRYRRAAPEALAGSA